ncbi:hypothetical protein BHM03_00005605 [Ensete ventricosum]|nr:hypothetical protein BHM03_00005605 [Ensete ventricosum]
MLSLQADARQHQPQQPQPPQLQLQLQPLFGANVTGGLGFHSSAADVEEIPFALQLLDGTADIKPLIAKPTEGSFAFFCVCQVDFVWRRIARRRRIACAQRIARGNRERAACGE